MSKNQMIVFWRISYSPHMDSLFDELRKLIGDENVRVVYFERLRSERIAQGWAESISSSQYTVLEPNSQQLDELMSYQAENVIHVFTGILYFKPMRSVFYLLRQFSCKKVILSEGRDFHGLLGSLRRVQSWWVESRNKRWIHRVLAYGHRGVSTYRAIGIPNEKIQPFAYVVNSSQDLITSINSDVKATATKQDEVVQLGIVGRLIPLKRVDLVIESLACISNDNWALTIVGDGEKKAYLEALIKDLDMQPGKIKFTGVLPNEEVKSLMKTFDYTLFPSNGDGWGAVVNESLLVGTPVICSCFPGAADLIHSGFNGWKFETDNQIQLCDVLEKVISAGKVSDAKRQEICTWSECIQPPAVARYFIEAVQTFDQEPLWKRVVDGVAV